ncbi:tape measure protein [Acinetobacter baumannii]|nr:tape measure protein [Acinetobacter baumannii]EKW6893400.1 tape measure protein [Acinetobacter baumannii]ELA8682982.1 tape measure protein [Acinetobacter baumannii]ELB2335340.1 tape measure protein [Acinetobacter baumannii]ELB2346444.1 tape measure protein [Acinetobacter baumannii]
MTQESRLVITIDSRNAERNARNLGNELDSIEKKGDFASKSMDSVSVATRALAGHMAGLVTIGTAVSKMDTYTGLQNRLKLVTTNQIELNKATEDTFRIAQKTYSAWDSVLQVYQRFSDNAKTLNLTMDDTARLTETVSKAVAISGASAAAADAALVQFGQALASGTLRGEELNSVMEQTPALAKAIAQGMGITVGELRTVAAEGKITSQEIVKALKNVQADVDALFAKTDITISQSLTLLNNEITKFVGESGKGSGAAEVLSGSIKTLAGNLDVLTSAMMVGGAYWLGTYIPAIYASGVAVAAKTKELAAQTFAQYTAIQADRAAAAQQVLSTQAVVANTQATLAAIAAEKALEVQRLKSQITEKGRTATLTRMAELKKIEAQVTRELAVAEGALASAQARSAAAGAASVGIGSRLLGLLGGPVGIGITVASLAAGYLLMRDNGDKANDMLEKQSRYAGMAADELMKLEGAQKRAAESELTKQLSLQNAQLSKSQNEFLLLTQSITDNNKQSAEAYRIWAELKTGVIDVNQAFNRLNQLSFISSDQINQLADSKKKVDENTKAVKQTNSELNQVRTSGANAKAGFNDVSQGAKGAGQDVSELNKKLQDLQKTYAQKNLDTDFSLINIKSHGLEMGKALSDFYDNNKIPKTRSLTKDEWAIFQKNFDKVQELKKLEEDIADSKRQQTKELEKQQKVLAVNSQVKSNASKYNFSDLESKYDLLPGLLSAINMQESRGDANVIGPNTKYGKAKGGFQMLDGTAKRWGLVGKEVFDTGKAAEAAAKYLNFLFKKFGNWDQAISAYHAGEGNVEKGTNIGPVNRQYVKNVKGYIAGSNGFDMKGVSEKDFDSYLNQFLKTQEETEKLRDQYRDKDTLAEKEYLKRIGELKLHFKDAELKQLTDKETARYNAQKELNAEQLEFELNEFRLNEVQKLEKQKQIKLLQIKASTEYSETEKEIRIKAVNAMFDYEISEYRKLQKQKLEEYRKTMYEQASIPQSDVINLLAKKNLTSSQYDSWNLQNQYSDEMQNANDAYSSNVKAISEDKTIVDEEKRFQALLDAEELFRQQKYAINEKYTLMEQELQKSSRQTEIEIYGQLLSQASSVWGNMTAMVKESAGEQSAAYKAMFLVQQAMAMGTATIQAYQAYSNVLANAPYPLNMTMAPIALGLGMANVGLIAAQTIAGFSDGGYTGNGLKHTPAGIVHKGEVVWSQEDIKRWGGVSVVESMRQSNPSGYANGGYVSNNQSDAIAIRRESRQFEAINSNQSQLNTNEKPINVYVTVNADGTSKTETENDSKQLGQMIGNAVRTIIRQEQRQGGLLSK